MATYFFETITAARALSCGTDVLCFANDGADKPAGGGGKAAAKPDAEKAPAKPEAQAAQTDKEALAELVKGALEEEPNLTAEGLAEKIGATLEDVQAVLDDLKPAEEPKGADSKEEPQAAVEEPEEAPSRAQPALLGLAKINHPDGATSVSHGGQTYEADEDGVFTVPLVAAEDLFSHGFALVD